MAFRIVTQRLVMANADGRRSDRLLIQHMGGAKVNGITKLTENLFLQNFQLDSAHNMHRNMSLLFCDRQCGILVLQNAKTMHDFECGNHLFIPEDVRGHHRLSVKNRP